MAFIEVKGLGLTQREKVILQNIDLGIEKGEFFVLIGPTGAGKTSLLKLLDLLVKPSSGTISIGGTMVGPSGRGSLALRRHMAFVQQKPMPFNMSVFDNVAAGLRWRGKYASEVKQRVLLILEQVDLSNKRRQNARTLSGGEMQRVAIARAIVTDPEVLYLDEPTANLDPISSAKIEEVLGNIVKESKITVLMATHDMSQGQRLARRIGVMMDGRLLQIGSASDIFTHPESRQVAEFVGVDNIWSGVVTEQNNGLLNVRVNEQSIQVVGEFDTGAAVNVLIRPEEITLAISRNITSARNTFKGRVVSIGYQGPLVRIQLECGFPVLSLITRRSADEMNIAMGSELYASFKATSTKVVKRW
jgi:tungstate transport system ATP-binding protein